MFAGLLAALMLWAQGSSIPPEAFAPQSLSPEAAAATAPVVSEISRVREDLARLPPPRTDAEKLIRMGRLDQAPRVAFGKLNLSGLSVEDRKAAMSAIWGAITTIDRANQAELLSMVPAEGWFLSSLYGREASEAAFHIVQHADLEMQKRFLPIIEPLVARDEVNGEAYAKMYDRVSVREGRAQRYGSQFRCEGGKWVPDALEDPTKVEVNRKAMGMSTFADRVAHFAAMPPC